MLQHSPDPANSAILFYLEEREKLINTVEMAQGKRGHACCNALIKEKHSITDSIMFHSMSPMPINLLEH